jgi:ABC-type sulfate transport system permease component
LSVVFLAMLGFSQVGERALTNTAIQIATPQNLLGRVLSLFFMDRGLWSLGGLMIGTSASAIGIDWTFAVCSVVCTIAAISLFVVSRKQRTLAAERQAAAEIAAEPRK